MLPQATLGHWTRACVSVQLLCHPNDQYLGSREEFLAHCASVMTWEPSWEPSFPKWFSPTPGVSSRSHLPEALYIWCKYWAKGDVWKGGNTTQRSVHHDCASCRKKPKRKRREQTPGWGHWGNRVSSSCVVREAAQPTGNWKGAAAPELPGVNKALRMPGFRCCVAGRLNGGSTWKIGEKRWRSLLQGFKLRLAWILCLQAFYESGSWKHTDNILQSLSITVLIFEYFSCSKFPNVLAQKSCIVWDYCFVFMYFNFDICFALQLEMLKWMWPTSRDKYRW